jgi:hypothetical protein
MSGQAPTGGIFKKDLFGVLFYVQFLNRAPGLYRFSSFIVHVYILTLC